MNYIQAITGLSSMAFQPSWAHGNGQIKVMVHTNISNIIGLQPYQVNGSIVTKINNVLFTGRVDLLWNTGAGSPMDSTSLSSSLDFVISNGGLWGFNMGLYGLTKFFDLSAFFRVVFESKSIVIVSIIIIIIIFAIVSINFFIPNARRRFESISPP